MSAYTLPSSVSHISPASLSPTLIPLMPTPSPGLSHSSESIACSLLHQAKKGNDALIKANKSNTLIQILKKLAGVSRINNIIERKFKKKWQIFSRNASRYSQYQQHR
jgi:hypothetical protein